MTYNDYMDKHLITQIRENTTKKMIQWPANNLMNFGRACGFFNKGRVKEECTMIGIGVMD